MKLKGDWQEGVRSFYTKEKKSATPCATSFRFCVTRYSSRVCRGVCYFSIGETNAIALVATGSGSSDRVRALPGGGRHRPQKKTIDVFRKIA